ncbi:MAG: outer membrane beta-barrel protein [Bacteroidales bacterium]|nr:outer membrane beta-barrel protein [Bacteroidales bacterium]
MKKLFSVLALATFMVAAFNSNAQLGVNFGYAPETLTQKTTSGSTTVTTTSKTQGLFLGLNYNMKVTGDLKLSLGGQLRYNFSNNADNVNFFGLASGNNKVKTTQIYLDVPVLFNYGLNLSNDLSISFFAGPTLIFALYGNQHVTTTATLLGASATTETDYDYYGDNGNYNSFDISATAGASLGYKELRLFGGYRYGLLNQYKGDNTTCLIDGFFFGLGYKL